jgi:uncharacterized protein with von Willebrand factor type A (vWA) domain
VSDALVRNLACFGRVLREAGSRSGRAPGRRARGPGPRRRTRQDDVYWTLRTTLVTRGRSSSRSTARSPRGSSGRPVPPPRRQGEDPRQAQRGAQRRRRDARLAAAAPPPDGPPEAIGHSGHEVLRRKDFAAMTPAELAEARALIAGSSRAPAAALAPHAPEPPGAALDLRALARASVATGGDPVHRRFRRRTERPRKLVVLCDVSGSMEAYTRALLVFLHATVRSGRGVEVFAFGTRLTRLTPELRSRDPEQALARAAARVVDWAGGTRIGASLKAYNDVWGRRALTRGAVALIVSDGWESEDHALVGREMARLHRAAYAVVWVNPAKGGTAYEPRAAGMRAALPHIDRFVSGHDVASLEALAGLVAGIQRRHEA